MRPRTHTHTVLEGSSQENIRRRPSDKTRTKSTRRRTGISCPLGSGSGEAPASSSSSSSSVGARANTSMRSCTTLAWAHFSSDSSGGPHLHYRVVEICRNSYLKAAQPAPQALAIAGRWCDIQSGRAQPDICREQPGRRGQKSSFFFFALDLGSTAIRPRFVDPLPELPWRRKW